MRSQELVLRSLVCFHRKIVCRYCACCLVAVMMDDGEVDWVDRRESSSLIYCLEPSLENHLAGIQGLVGSQLSLIDNRFEAKM